MTMRFFMPRVSGSLHTFAGSVPVKQAAACRSIPEPDPAVTSPASAPVSLAITSPALRLSSCRSTKLRDASSIALTTGVGMILPPATVTHDQALITGLTPSRS